MTEKILTQDRLRSLLDYDPEAGVFTRRVTIRHFLAGVVIGTVGTRGYLQCNLDGKPYKLHRLAWLYVHGVWPTGQIDHINHNTSDNRFCNLRDVSSAENHQNRARRTKSKSGYLGVTWHKRDCRWQATIEVAGHSYHLGNFKDLPTAIAARVQAEKRYHPNRPN
jgi:hypothetical protein